MAPDEARVHLREEMSQCETDVRRSSHLEVSAPDSGAGQALVQGQQVQTVGVGAALDLVTGARLESDSDVSDSCDDCDDSDLAGQTRAPHPGLADQLGVEADGEAVDGGLEGGDQLLADVGGGGRGGGRDLDTQPAVAELLHHQPDLNTR